MLIVCVLLLGTVAILLYAHRDQPKAPEPPLVPDFQVTAGAVRPPLPYRIISFHRGRIDKDLVKLAHNLGFNGVQIQLEGSNEGAVKELAERDAKEHLIQYCHDLGMQVTIWVREFSDLPPPWLPNSLGENNESNDKLFTFLDQRYEWVLGKMLPNVDGLVLTVVETQSRATKTPVLMRVVDTVRKKCDKYKKSLIVRTFVWTPEEFSGVMAAVDQLPKDTVIMSKCVPQDWQMRGADAKEIGAVGGRDQIIEFDVAGEYFLRNTVANCMPDLLKRQFDYAVSKGVKGICVRADRFDDDVLFQPSEVNLWTLGLLAAGASDNTEDIWRRWATYRYGEKAAPAVIKALKPTGEVVTEMLSIGPFTYGDTRKVPDLPDMTGFLENWQNWRWDPATYEGAHQKFLKGDPQFIAEVRGQKAAAMKLADESLAELEKAKPALDELDKAEYAILFSRLANNKIQLQLRSAMQMTALDVRAAFNATTREQLNEAIQDAMKQLPIVLDIAALYENARPKEITYRGRKFKINGPDAGDGGRPPFTDPQYLRWWAWASAQLFRGERMAFMPVNPSPPPAPATQPFMPFGAFNLAADLPVPGGRKKSGGGTPASGPSSRPAATQP